MKSDKLYFILCLLISVAYSSLKAQEGVQMQQLLKDDSVDINVLSTYSAEVRENLFLASLHPEGIAKLKDLQKKSNESFKNSIASYSKDDQQKIWNLTRYENLFSDLSVTGGKKRKVEDVLKKYPAEIHDDAYFFSTENFQLIQSIVAINKDYSKSYDLVIAGYSEKEKAAYSSILKTPEAVNLLTNNMHLTVHLGDLYRSSPELLRSTLDSLNRVNAEQNARDAENFKKEIKNNPEAEKELKESALEYAKENQYKENDYKNVNPEVVNRYIFVPYPYWCGYPWWYAYDYWYPYPVWYHWGFYYWHDDIVWLGPPSWYFIHWHFHSHPHFYDYPHITNVYINQYHYGPRRGISGNSREVNTWMSRNSNSFPDDFRNNSERRVDRIREFGKLENDRDRFNRDNPGKNISRDDYMKLHENEYPQLKRNEGGLKDNKEIEKRDFNVNPLDKVKPVENKEIKSRDQSPNIALPDITRPQPSNKIDKPKIIEPKNNLPQRKPSESPKIVIPPKENPTNREKTPVLPGRKK